MDKWRDIETAPRDGTRVLLAMGDGDVRDGWWDGEVELVAHPTIDQMIWRGAWVDGEVHGSIWGLVKVEYDPTHWQPLPSPPENEG